jgi:dipeptidyl aminopeptidase/acylaminoacyl peptidase
MRFWRSIGAGVAAAALLAGAPALAAPASNFTVAEALSYPFISDLVRAPASDRIAWVRTVKGVRNVWVAEGPSFSPRQVTAFTADDGQELTQLTFSPDGATLVFVRGGDHDSNWPAKGGLQPNPTSSPIEPKVEIWSADPTGAKPAAKLTEGDAPALSAKGQLAYIKDGQIWTVGLDGKDAKRLAFDKGKDSALVWSPDGGRLAFVSNRDDHAFVGVYQAQDKPILWLTPSTDYDLFPVWSPDGSHIAYVRLPGNGGPPDPLLKNTPLPWSIWTADAATGTGKEIWHSGSGLRDSFPDFAGNANLHWAKGGNILFLSEADNWPHLYTVPEGGGAAKLLTPGDYMVEHLDVAADGKSVVYSANTGATKDDDDRRHLFRVSLSGGAPVAVTKGESLEWSPVALSSGAAFIGADARRPTAVEVVDAKGGARHALNAPPLDPAFPGAKFVTPRQVSWTAPDGLVVHGQLFQSPDGAARKPGLIFVHGGPPRQMMLGWSYMRYYSNAYAMNQYLAAHGFTVLSVNYRLGIGYGFDFQHPDKGGAAGSSEYQDVLAGGKYLQSLPGVDPGRIGIWGGSYGGLLTALALARNSETFKAGVDLHGVHDWSRVMAEEQGRPSPRFEQGDWDAAIVTAYKASPVADIGTWTSPVLLIQGDDDRNVYFNQTIDLARRLKTKGVDFEELVIPDDIHDFLRHANWQKADEATAEYLARQLGVK